MSAPKQRVYRIDPDILAKNKRTLELAGTLYVCQEVGCEETPTHGQTYWPLGEGRPDLVRNRHLCEEHAKAVA